MLDASFSGSKKVKKSMFKDNNWLGCRVHFNSSGKLELKSKIGASSSSALTSAFVLGLNKIFEIGLGNLELSETDIGEFYLGKTAGCADKATILNAEKGKLIAISSIPDRFIQSLTLPQQIVVMMVNSNIPRLNSLNGKKYLLNLKDSNSMNIYTPKQVDGISNHFNSIMRCFGSFVFVYSIESIIEQLKDENKLKSFGITNDESNAVLKSFGYELNRETNQYSIIDLNRKPLLRELCSGGELERILPSHSGSTNRHKRYNLIFKLLKFLPESIEVMIGDSKEIIHPRKSALYGISEIERCYGYLEIMNELCNKSSEGKHLYKLLNLIRWAHDGDRVISDYRKDFQPTDWANNERNLVNDKILDSWISNDEEEIFNKPGGFERSLPEFDEWANSLDETFKKQAVLRVSAAGLGGTICVHSLSKVSKDVEIWLKQKGLSVQTINPGPSYEIF